MPGSARPGPKNATCITPAPGGRHPAAPGSRCESGLTAQFTAIFTGCSIDRVATPQKMAAGAGSPSARRSYGDHEHGAHPVAAEAKARSRDPRRGVTAAVLSVRTARGCQAGRRWAGLAALLIGAASAPQAAMSGFHGPYMIPDTATAVLGVLLAVAVLATAGGAGQPGQYTE